ncbi:TPA: hypothetical protein ACG3KH_004309, partial [Clostridioides difficile]
MTICTKHHTGHDFFEPDKKPFFQNHGNSCNEMRHCGYYAARLARLFFEVSNNFSPGRNKECTACIPYANDMNNQASCLSFSPKQLSRSLRQLFRPPFRQHVLQYSDGGPFKRLNLVKQPHRLIRVHFVIRASALRKRKQ